MSDHLFSRFWPRICQLKPALQGQVRTVRQTFRGEHWTVLQDQATGQHHRLSSSAYYIVSLMDGERTLESIWQQALEQLGEDLPSQAELLQILSMLYKSDLLNLGKLPDLDELSERIARRQKQERKRFANPLAVRIPLWNPDRFLTRTYPFIKWVFTPYVAFAYIALLLAGLVQLGLQWSTITSSLSDRLLAAESLIPMLFIYPLVKVAHELGHGYVVKHWGGHVRQLGVMLLVFFPVPYVDASDSAGFQDKRHRALVGAAGILVELGVAAIAILLWSAMEPGLGRALLFNVMVLSGISTLLFNGNPLLRFDGYYVLSDLVEIPNLGTRGSRYFRYLLTRALGVEGLTNPAKDDAEARWLLSYSVLSFLYRITVVMAIALLLVNNYFVVGALLALWAVFNMFLSPLLKGIWYLYDSSQLQGQRKQAITRVAAAMLVLASILLLIPVPHGTSAQGVVWLSDRSLVRAEVEGIVASVNADDQVMIEAGYHILTLANPVKDALVRQLQATLEEMKLRRRAMSANDRAGVQVVDEQILQVEASLIDALSDQSALRITAKQSGRLVLPSPSDTPGRYVNRGDVTAYVLPQSTPGIRVVVPEDRIDLVRNDLRGISVRLSWDIHSRYEAELVRQVPAATTSVPSPALVVEGGGDVVLDPTAEYSLTSLKPIFVLDLAVPDAPAVTDWAGARVHVRFDHGYEVIAVKIWRTIRLLFLRELNV